MTKWTVEVELDDGSTRRVRGIEAHGPSHVRVKVVDKLTAAGFKVVRVNWTTPEGESVPPRASCYAARQAEREALARPWGKLG